MDKYRQAQSVIASRHMTPYRIIWAEDMSADQTEELILRVCERIPWMEEGTLRAAHGGQDGMTPDQRAIIGQAGPDGHFLLCGFSGSGFKTAPAIGLGVAELILDGQASTVDIAPYGLARFGRGELLVGEHAYPDLWQSDDS